MLFFERRVSTFCQMIALLAVCVRLHRIVYLADEYKDNMTMACFAKMDTVLFDFSRPLLTKLVFATHELTVGQSASNWPVATGRAPSARLGLLLKQIQDKHVGLLCDAAPGEDLCR